MNPSSFSTESFLDIKHKFAIVPSGILLSLALSILCHGQDNRQRSPAWQANLSMQKGVNLGGMFENVSSNIPNVDRCKKMIDIYYEHGFRNFRLPFTWANCSDLKTGEINFNHPKTQAYIELINYILENRKDAFVFINSHHDKWYDRWSEYKPGFKTLWTNIANHFQNYDLRLVFEIDNEPFQRTELATPQVTREMMKIGWDAIRKTGGKNSSRLIMIAPLRGQSYHLLKTYPDIKSLNEITGGDNRNVIMSIHIYSPWSFVGSVPFKAGEQGEGATFSISKIRRLVEEAATWSQKLGVPINVGEMGVAWADPKRYESGVAVKSPTKRHIDWYYLATREMVKHEFSYSIWDDGGWFKMLDRKAMKLLPTADVLQPQTNNSPTEAP